MTNKRLIPWFLVLLLFGSTAAFLVPAPEAAAQADYDVRLTSRVKNAVLPCGPTDFQWVGPDSGRYAIHVGATRGANDYAARSTSAHNITIDDLPQDGSTVHVRLWYQPDTDWLIEQDTTYTACDNDVRLISRAKNAVLPCGPTDFQWVGPDSGRYAIHIGSTTGAKNYAARSTSAHNITIDDLPQDGSTIHVRLWHKPGTRWQIEQETTYTACGEVAQLPPAWVDGAELSLESLSRFDFEVSWGATAGTPDVFELTLTDQYGASSLEVIDARTYSSFAIGSFQGFALDPDNEYTLELVAVNSAGDSAAIGLGPLKVVNFGYQTDVEGYDSDTGHSFGSSNALPSGTTTSSGQWTASNCFRLTTKALLGETLIFRQDVQFHEVISELCHDGERITRNVVRANQQTCLDRSVWPGLFRDPSTAIVLTPDYRHAGASVGLEAEYAATPTSEQALEYLCSFTDDIEINIEGVGSSSINLGEGSNIRHEVRVVNGIFEWERFATPSG